MRRLASTIVIATFLAAGAAHPFEAAGADIIGLRLGMSEAEIVARLAHQGYAVTNSAGTITAKTMDGRLEIVLSADRGVTEISYAFYGRGAGAPAKIREAIIIRFGDPDQVNPPTWCRAVGQDGLCPKNEASLTFLADPLTLRLTAGQGRQR
jgi:hypothetical protein